MASKVKTKTGKVRYLSQVLRDRNKKLQRRNNGIDWADWRPRYRAGVFANVQINNYTHNRERKYL